MKSRSVTRERRRRLGAPKPPSARTFRRGGRHRTSPCAPFWTTLTRPGCRAHRTHRTLAGHSTVPSRGTQRPRETAIARTEAVDDQSQHQAHAWKAIPASCMHARFGRPAGTSPRVLPRRRRVVARVDRAQHVRAGHPHLRGKFLHARRQSGRTPSLRRLERRKRQPQLERSQEPIERVLKVVAPNS